MDSRNALLMSRNLVRTSSGGESATVPTTPDGGMRANAGLFAGLALILIAGLWLTAATGAVLVFGGPRS